jgi:hypothetical protein
VLRTAGGPIGGPIRAERRLLEPLVAFVVRNCRRAGVVVVAVLSTLCLGEVEVSARVRTGVLVFNGEGCSTVVVSTPLGFVVATQYSYPVLRNGDKIIGEMDRFGTQTWQVSRSRSKLRVYIDEYWVSADEAIEALVEDGCDLSEVS